MFFTREDSPIHHVGVTSMERPDQSSLHPSIKHRETDMFVRDLKPSRLGSLPGGHSTRELSRQLIAAYSEPPHDL
jgi:hypothetical protein